MLSFLTIKANFQGLTEGVLYFRAIQWRLNPGVYKKHKLGHAGREVYSHFDFLGKINEIFPVSKSKKVILLYKYSIFKYIVNCFKYFVCLYLLFCTAK